MSTIQKDLVAAIHYTLRNDDGEIVDTSEGRDPLEYLHGHGNLVAGLEAVLEGKAAGDTLKVSVAPEDGYGIEDEDLVVDVPRDYLPADEIQPGMRFTAETSNGMRLFTVIEIGEETVILDGNHPLAGETLHFDVEIVSIREPEPEELAHGHVHSGGHHHDDDEDEAEGGCGTGCGCAH
jgi:FKBP-type peptidyl-prolyl cis-trans isomerase SlyD